MSFTTPEMQMRAAYDAYITAAYALSDARKRGARAEICRADREMRALAETFNNVKASTRDAFARSRGWKYDRKRYARTADYGLYGRRIVKHPEFFRDSEGAHVAMITHTAATPEECAAYAVRNGYNAELLPFSWDSPTVHIAVLFTLKAGAKWP